MAEDNGFVLWLTGLSGAGKTTLAGRLVPELRARGLRVEELVIQGGADGHERRTDI